jgi:hypothetical protein
MDLLDVGLVCNLASQVYKLREAVQKSKETKRAHKQENDQTTPLLINGRDFIAHTGAIGYTPVGYTGYTPVGYTGYHSSGYTGQSYPYTGYNSDGITGPVQYYGHTGPTQYYGYTGSICNPKCKKE